ncbi:hypothetical protein L6452_31973 [Arctium lappa]|uniref:Uncharacterized protein n=1 Tax=Arctium lappa TaxID=4217 RepID=A0ACB8Z3C8_ARCLA|nr:hypothetical protein L6452_31973 [Arctium lappa]
MTIFHLTQFVSIQIVYGFFQLYANLSQFTSTIAHGEILKANFYSDCNSELAVSSTLQFGILFGNRLMVQSLKEGNSDYEVLEGSFVGGMRDFGRNNDVSGFTRRIMAGE